MLILLGCTANKISEQEHTMINWNGDEYFIDDSFTKGMPCTYNNECITEEESQFLMSFLTNDVLDVWKKEVLKTISEDYLNQHIDIVSITGGGQLDANGNHKFSVGINYKFKSNNLIIPHTYPYPAKNEGIRDGFIIAEKRNGVWQKLTENEMTDYYNQELEKTHKNGQVKFTEQEITFSISKKEVLSKLKECHKDMEIKSTYIISENNTLAFFAKGSVYNCGITENCLPSAVGEVNLMTGQLTCTTN